ncbi:probable outer membrane receptor protein [Nonlabens ulvanivorans]|uniref:Probable outer membrane receptor protein n=2 Tax=Nonlabens ulvanivorans TaxID=906888 RepID=A0A090QSY2_NONUL|nr:TonB-dependent receptor [Nonlabens ulvanivorans]GAK98571.1 probable outer membrane receptor protein [Nonlabens ulvanivorans]
MKTLFLLLIMTLSISSLAQTIVSGQVIDEKNIPVLGANVYLKGTYDGTTTDIDGKFSFETTETSTVTLVASFIGYEDYIQQSDVRELNGVEIRFRESVNSLNSVILNAGTLSAGDSSKASALKPLDIVTTAGAVGDFVGALQTLPGTSANPDDGRLFVRGGSGEETQVFIDNSRVFRPFVPVTGNIPTRGRFSPFLFDGISFSTGGYSAEYGDALSSVLLLNTTDIPTEEKTDLQIMSVGGGVGNTQIWGKNSVSVNASYINLGPYNQLIPQNNQFEDPYESISGEAVYRHQLEKGMFKAYSAYSYSNFSILQEDINIEDGIFFGLKNGNYYGNLNYEQRLNNDWKIETGLSLAHDRNDINLAGTDVDTRENALHAKIKLRKRYNNYFKIHYGVEQFLINYKESVVIEDNAFESSVNSSNSGVFTEAEVFLSKDLAFKAGVRADYYGLSEELLISPRLSAAISVSKNWQASIAYGQFYQQAQNNILQYNEQLAPESAEHYILNFLYQKDGRMLRAETYYKNYSSLLTYDTDRPQFDSNFEVNGDGYATGLDIFWRDEKTVKNLDYWISYSYLDTERQYLNFQETATPNFASSHNFSAVGKYWVEDLKSQIGITYNYTSGRTFTNPNLEGFLNDKTASFQSLNLNWAYLIDQQKIVFLSVTNILGRENIFNYQYSNTPDQMGNFDRRSIGQAADRFIFVGFFWTLGSNDNQLDNL